MDMSRDDFGSFKTFQSMVLNGDNPLPHPRHLAVSQDGAMGGATDIQWIEARSATKHPTIG